MELWYIPYNGKCRILSISRIEFFTWSFRVQGFGANDLGVAGCGLCAYPKPPKRDQRPEKRLHGVV